MSLENDARQCLLAAIKAISHQSLDAGDLNAAKPSDPDFSFEDAIGWRKVLDKACACLSDKGYKPGEPTNDKAGDLRTQVMALSQGYLEELATPRTAAREMRAGKAPSAGMSVTKSELAVGAALFVVATAVATTMWHSRSKRRRSK
jgi:hypothetical protein